MLEYLSEHFDWSNPDLVSAHDDLSLWSAYFGHIFLEHVKLMPRSIVLDIGCGTGFPMLELSQRLGRSSTLYGIDIRRESLRRVKLKAKIYAAKDVVVLQNDASSMTFKNNSFDMIVSNVGVNNFKNPQKVFSECFRVAKPDASIALTTNPAGHMKEFYDVYRTTLRELKMDKRINRLESQMQHRLSIESLCDMLKKAGFEIISTIKDSFTMRFASGTAFLNHFFIKYAFLEGWKSILQTEELNDVFTKLEHNLNLVARNNKELRMTIPAAYIEGLKQS